MSDYNLDLLLQENGSLPDRDQVFISVSMLYSLGSLLNRMVLWTSFLFTLAMQDLKPRFHSSRFHGSDDAEDDVCF